MITELFESLDEKVLTKELKDSISDKFNEAVDIKSSSIVDERLEEELDSLNGKSEEHIEMLDEKSKEHIEMLDEKSKEHIEMLNVKSEEHIEMLDEKSEEVSKRVDEYLERIVDEFVNESKDALAQSVKSEKAEMITEAYAAMMVATGVKLSDIVEARVVEDDSTKINELVEENIALSKENDLLIKMGVIGELSEGLSIVEADKFKRLAEMVDFTKSSAFAEKLETIKESIKGSAAPLKETKLDESTKQAVWSHLV